ALYACDFFGRVNLSDIITEHAISFDHSRFRQTLELNDSTLTAFSARNSIIESSLDFRRSHVNGMVDLSNSRFPCRGCWLDLTGARIAGDMYLRQIVTKGALYLRQLSVEGAVFAEKLRSTQDSAIHLAGAHLEGDLTFLNAVIRGAFLADR